MSVVFRSEGSAPGTPRRMRVGRRADDTLIKYLAGFLARLRGHFAVENGPESVYIKFWAGLLCPRSGDVRVLIKGWTEVEDLVGWCVCSVSFRDWFGLCMLGGICFLLLRVCFWWCPMRGRMKAFVGCFCSLMLYSCFGCSFMDYEIWL